MRKFLIISLLVLLTCPCYAFWGKEKEKDKTLIPYVDSQIGIAYAFEPLSGHTAEGYLRDTVRPFVGFGCRPFKFLKLNSPILEGLGFGIHTKIFSTGIHMYYSHAEMKPFFLAFTVGWEWDGNTIPGASFGARF
jgi:hypothetical protein